MAGDGAANAALLSLETAERSGGRPVEPTTAEIVQGIQAFTDLQEMTERLTAAARENSPVARSTTFENVGAMFMFCVEAEAHLAEMRTMVKEARLAPAYVCVPDADTDSERGGT